MRVQPARRWITQKNVVIAPHGLHTGVRRLMSSQSPGLVGGNRSSLADVGAIFARPFASPPLKELDEISGGPETREIRDLGNWMRGLDQQALGAIEADELNFIQNAAANGIAKTLFQIPPRDGDLFDDILDRNSAALFTANELQSGRNILVFHSDHVG